MSLRSWILASLVASSAHASEYGVFAITQEQGALHEKVRRATVAIVENEKLYSEDLFTLKDNYNFCTAKDFLEEKLWSNCSGTLIGKDIILTASHCIQKVNNCQDKSYVFDYKDNESIHDIQKDSRRVYKCKKVLAWSQSVPRKQPIDYAVIQLDRPVLDREPISISDGTLDHEQDILAFGHPLGLPMKMARGFVSADDAQKNRSNPQRPFFNASMNTHPGLSGGGVYDTNYNLLGILVRGDANIEKDGPCQRIKTCEKGDCPWAEVQKLPRTLIKKIKDPSESE